MTNVHIAVFVEGSGKYSTTILPKKAFHIGAATEEGHPKWCFRDNHLFFPSMICSLIESQKFEYESYLQ